MSAPPEVHALPLAAAAVPAIGIAAAATRPAAQDVAAPTLPTARSATATPPDARSDGDSPTDTAADTPLATETDPANPGGLLNTSDLAGRLTAVATESARRTAGDGVRVQVEVGRLDPRLRLAPCDRVEPFMPAGLPAWGRTRVGMRCVDGKVTWRVTLPVTVHVYAPAVVTTVALPAGTVLRADLLQVREVDIAAERGRISSDPADLVGRTLSRLVPAGEAVRENHVRARRYFESGATVRVTAGGDGWAASVEGRALSPGIEGRTVRVRTEGGRIVQGRAIAEHEVEIPL